MMEELLSAWETWRDALANLRHALFRLQQLVESGSVDAELLHACNRIINIENKVDDIICVIVDIELTSYYEADSSINESESENGLLSYSCPSSCSEDPAILGWTCDNCDGTSFTDPWGPDARCGCGHQYCQDGDDNHDDHDHNNQHCSPEWDPE
jgi:hypothetical protein